MFPPSVHRSAVLKLQAKLDRAFTLGLSYTQKLRAGVSLTLATSVKAGNLGGDGHQLGLSLTMEQ